MREQSAGMNHRRPLEKNIILNIPINNGITNIHENVREMYKLGEETSIEKVRKSRIRKWMKTGGARQAICV
jgi:hypothetical protein